MPAITILMTITIHDDIRNDDDNDSVANNDFQRMPSLTLEKGHPYS